MISVIIQMWFPVDYLLSLLLKMMFIIAFEFLIPLITESIYLTIMYVKKTLIILYAHSIIIIIK